MKTITERDGKNVNMQVVGDLHKYLDGSVHTVKNGKDVWEESGGGSGAGNFIMTIQREGSELVSDKSPSEALEAWNSGKPVYTNLAEYGVILPASTIVQNVTRFDGVVLATPKGEVIDAVYYVSVFVMEDKTCKLLTKSVSFQDDT